MKGSTRNITVRNAALRFLEENGPQTAEQIKLGARNYKGKPYRDMPSTMRLSQILKKDGRFVVLGKTKVKYHDSSTAELIVWGINYEK